MKTRKLTKRILAFILTLVLVAGSVSVASTAGYENCDFPEPEDGGYLECEYQNPEGEPEDEPNYGEYIVDEEDEMVVPYEGEGEATAGIVTDGYSVTIEAASTPNLNTTTVTFEHNQNVINAAVGDFVGLGTTVRIHVTNAAAANIRPTTPVTIQPMKDGLTSGYPFTGSWLLRDSAYPNNLTMDHGFGLWLFHPVQLSDAGSYTVRLYIGGVFAGESAPIIVNVTASAPPPDLSTTAVDFTHDRDVVNAVVGDVVDLWTTLEVNVTNAAAANIRATTPLSAQTMKDGFPFGGLTNMDWLPHDLTNANDLSHINSIGLWWFDDVQLADSGSYTLRIYIGGVFVGESAPIILNVTASAPSPNLNTTTVTFTNERDVVHAVVDDWVILTSTIEIIVANAAVANIRPTTPITIVTMRNGVPVDAPQRFSALREDEANPNNLIVSIGNILGWFNHVQLADAGSYTMRIYIGGVFAGQSSPVILNVTAGGSSSGGGAPGSGAPPPPEPPQPPQQPPRPPLSPQQPPWRPGGADSSRDDDRGIGGGNIANRVLSAFTPVPQEVWKTPQMATSLMQSAVADNQNFTRSHHDGRYGVRAAAWANLEGMRFEHDTTDVRGVQARITFQNPAEMSGDVLVSAWVQGIDVNRVQSIFESFFSNSVRVVHFDHGDQWGQTARVAARIDLTGMDVENLYFYSYNREANTFRPIAEPNYRIDANGFLHYNTNMGGSIIISDGPLELR